MYSDTVLFRIDSAANGPGPVEPAG